MTPPQQTQNAAKKTPTLNASRKEVHPKIVPSFKREDADIKMDETDDEATDEEVDPQHDRSQKTVDHVDRYQHDSANPFRLNDVQRR